MAKIKIIQGNYGYNNGDSIKVKTPKSEPFNVSDAEAARIVGLGIAEIIKSENDYIPNDLSGGELPKTEDGSEIPEDIEIPEYSEESTNSELQSIAKQYGIEIVPKATKAQLLKALDDYFAGV